MACLVAQNVSIVFGHRSIVHDVSLKLEPGTFTAIVGPNGAGKTTMLKGLAGLLPLESGGVRLNGIPLHTLKPIERAKALGYLAQSANPEWSLSVRALISLGRLPWQQGIASNAMSDETAIEKAIATLDLSKFADRMIETLSGGELARVLLARVLAGQPRWILADEPLTHLDLAYQVALFSALKTEAKHGTGVIVVVHDLNLAMRFANRIVMMKDGRVMAEGKARDTLNAATIRAAFGIDVELHETKAGLAIMPVA